MNILKNKKSIGILIFSMIATNLVTYHYSTKKSKEASEVTALSSSNNNSSCHFRIKRMDGYNFIKPILTVDDQCESDNLNQVKQSVNDLIENYKKAGVINSASCYIKEFNENGWTTVNGDEKYLPGSLLKVPELIAYLKMNEIRPGTLDKVIAYDKIIPTDRTINFSSKSIQLGQKYTVLKYMIDYSDNNATVLLSNNIDFKIFKNVFTDFGLPAPDFSSRSYPITAREFSVFMRSLYSSTYLNDENSEYAIQLLSKCDFKEGMIAGLPNNAKVAHKFGEAGTQVEQQLSESAIIYLDNNPYAITIMTKGKDMKKLPSVIKDISNTVYQNMLLNTSL